MNAPGRSSLGDIGWKMKRPKEKDIRTLCYSCRQGYISAGFILRRTASVVKDKCMICDRPGWDYEIEERKDGRKRE